MRVSVKQKETEEATKTYNYTFLIFYASYFHFHNKENWLFSFSCFRFQFSITVSMIASDCMHEREKGQLRTGERENPHPPNRVCGCIFIDSISLFFWKNTVAKNTTKSLAFYIFLAIYNVALFATF